MFQAAHPCLRSVPEDLPEITSLLLLAPFQVFDNATMNAEMALPDCVPFYGHGHVESDPGWGIAGWLVPDKFATFYDDDGG
jgi:hypothetical protein